MACQICGVDDKKDLFSFVTQSPTCSICTIKYMGGLPQTSERIAQVRERLGLKSGEMLKHDRANEAKQILGR